MFRRTLPLLAKSSDLVCYQPGTPPAAPGVIRPIRIEFLRLARVTHVNTESVFGALHDPVTGDRLVRQVYAPQTEEVVVDHVLDKSVAYVEPVVSVGGGGEVDRISILDKNAVPNWEEIDARMREKERAVAVKKREDRSVSIAGVLAERLARHGLNVDAQHMREDGVNEDALEKLPLSATGTEETSVKRVNLPTDDNGQLTTEAFLSLATAVKSLVAEQEDKERTPGSMDQRDKKRRKDNRSSISGDDDELVERIMTRVDREAM